MCDFVDANYIMGHPHPPDCKEETRLELAKRVAAIKPSPTLSVTTLAARLKSEGKDIISLGAGEPDFDTPEPIKAAAIRAIQDGFTKYTAVDGTPSLKKAIIAKFKRDNDLEYEPNQIIVSCGGKQSFFNLVQAVINPGDEVIIPAPYWVSYPDIVLIADGRPVHIDADIAQGFKITPQQLRAAISPRTRMVVLNSPSNPTGAMYSREELRALGEVLREFPSVVIASDDMYEHILLDSKPFTNILNVCPDLYERTVVLNGVSKAYAMTGWRIGYAAGPTEIVRAMTNIQSQSTSNPASISQVAAQAALEGDQSCIRPMVEAFAERHRYIVDALNGIDGVECLPSCGAFYAFPKVEVAIQRLFKRGTLSAATDVAFTSFLLEEAGIAVVPGSAFGAEGYVRLSFATSLTNLQGAIARMQRALR